MKSNDREFGKIEGEGRALDKRVNTAHKNSITTDPDVMYPILQELIRGLSDMECLTLFKSYYEKITLSEVKKNLIRYNLQNIKDKNELILDSYIYTFREQALQKLCDGVLREGGVDVNQELYDDAVISHSEFRGLIDDYLADELMGTTKFNFENHMLACDFCGELLLLNRRIVDIITDRGMGLFAERMNSIFPEKSPLDGKPGSDNPQGDTKIEQESQGNLEVDEAERKDAPFIKTKDKDGDKGCAGKGRLGSALCMMMVFLLSFLMQLNRMIVSVASSTLARLPSMPCIMRFSRIVNFFSSFFPL